MENALIRHTFSESLFCLKPFGVISGFIQNATKLLASSGERVRTASRILLRVVITLKKACKPVEKVQRIKVPVPVEYVFGILQIARYCPKVLNTRRVLNTLGWSRIERVFPFHHPPFFNQP